MPKIECGNCKTMNVMEEGKSVKCWKCLAPISSVHQEAAHMQHSAAGVQQECQCSGSVGVEETALFEEECPFCLESISEGDDVVKISQGIIDNERFSQGAKQEFAHQECCEELIEKLRSILLQ